MELRTEIVPVQLPNGAVIQVEATALGGDEKVSFKSLDFEGVLTAIEGIAQSVVATLEKVKPQEASVELGLEVGLESGELIAVLVKGSGKANLKVTLKWASK
jgi:hypothetical protein